eukprot:CAMPEP_0179010810 /NCGR_PEP_ID=MMETSP0796-20121207/325_1 /TAXON_ID=73915 /ORGANISM="Pyrodinium bahamense, Strain pbaha01" /LENGTH=59 /DNA_ID=CAMNT_0020706139 /DNA_START=23 /DNA_END=202 /DNA_ORIENTATION=+
MTVSDQRSAVTRWATASNGPRLCTDVGVSTVAASRVRDLVATSCVLKGVTPLWQLCTPA